MSHSHRPGTDFVEPDLPITPMLDMSFQLLAFFIMTFKPMPTEGQIAMSLPPPDFGGAGIPVFPDALSEPTRYIVRVTATERGAIEAITVSEDGVPGERPIAADVAALVPELKALNAAEQKRRDAVVARGFKAPPPPKLTLELGPRLLQAYVVQLVDAGVQAGFINVAPIPIDNAKR